MYEHAIPQNIMDYEFKLFAGLSLKQFIYVAVAGGFAFGLFMMNRNGMLPSFFAWIVIPITIIVGGALGVGKFNGRTTEDWMTSYKRATQIPLRRVWKKDKKAVTSKNFFSTKPKKLPTYLAAYFYSQDEFRKIIQNGLMQTKNPEIKAEEIINSSPVVAIAPTMFITSQNSHEYAEPSVVLPSIPNTIALKISDDNIPLEGVVAYMKDEQSKVVTALRSNNEGIIYFNQSVSDGEYEIELQAQEDISLPVLKVRFDGTTFPLINIKPN